MDKKSFLPLVVFFIFILITPIITSLFGINYYLVQLTMSLYYAFVSIGLCMLMGYAGQVSLGQAAFFAAGGYTTAVLTTVNLINLKENIFIQFLVKIKFLILEKGIYGDEVIYVSPLISLLVAILISVFISSVIGSAVLKLKGHYLAMATLGFGIIVYKVIKGVKLLGLADGISGVPSFKILSFITIDGKASNRIASFYFAGFLVLITIFFFLNLINSRSGRALRSLHGGEEASSAMGINTAKYKRVVFVLAAVTASIAGFFLTHYNGAIGPSEAGIMKSVRYVAIVAVGGMANVWGVLVFGILLNFFSLRGMFAHFDDAVFGLILIFVMIFAPNGVFKKDIVNKIFLKIKKFYFLFFKREDNVKS